MGNDKSGGAAFPLEHHEKCNAEYANGMTLRDYFAGQALTGILSNTMLFKTIHDDSTDSTDIARTVARLTGEYADAMIKEDNHG